MPIKPPRSQSVVPADLQGVVAALGILSALVVAVLAVTHHGSHVPDSFDRPVSAIVHAVWPHVGIAALVVDGVAGPVPAVIIVTALVVGCLLAKQWRLALVAMAGPLSAAATATALKPLIERTINGDNLAFPSGHTAFATAVAMLLGLLLIAKIRPGPAVGVSMLAGLAVVVGAVMALDQIILNAHYPSDTVGGFFTAVAVVSVTAMLTDGLAGVLVRGRDLSQKSPDDKAMHLSQGL